MRKARTINGRSTRREGDVRGGGEISPVQQPRRSRAVGVAAVLLAAAATLALAASAANANVIYNSIPSLSGSVPGYVHSEGLEDSASSELGGPVTFAGSARTNPTVTVLMVLFRCENPVTPCNTTPGATFPQEITLNVYRRGTVFTEGSPPGSLIASVTKAFNINYEPAA